VNTVPGEWTPFHDEVDAVPAKMDSKAERRAARAQTAYPGSPPPRASD